MNAQLRKLFAWLDETFWILPAAMVTGGILLALVLVHIDRSGVVPASLIEGSWLYNGGATGARTLLGAVASSTIGVAGTVFSITIAALSLAAGQMGPRLLRNFTHDRGNQFTLGVYLATFSYTLMVLRSVRTQEEGAFIPHLSLSVSIALAFVCVATLVYFVDHMATRINVDTVIELVAADVGTAIERFTVDDAGTIPPAASFWRDASPVVDRRSGYLQHFDGPGLARWASEHGTTIRMLVRPGDFVFPGAPIAVLTVETAGADVAIRNATVLGAQRTSQDDPEFAIRQLVEVAVRALSPGINDPHTAMSVLDRLGAALCATAGRHLPSGVCTEAGKVVLVSPTVDYDGLADAMFHMIRQNASGSTAVLARMLEVLTAVVGCETEETRIATLQRHAGLIVGDATRDIATPADLDDVRARHAVFESIRAHGACGRFMPVGG